MGVDGCLHIHFILKSPLLDWIKFDKDIYSETRSFRFHLEAVGLNTSLRKIVNGGNLILGLLTWDHCN
jgi:hypothetical protein